MANFYTASPSGYFRGKSEIEESGLKMSAESELTRDKDSFLTCKDCPRIFFTVSVFEYHLSNQHKKGTEKKLNFGQRSNLKNHIDAVHKKLTPYQCKECKKSFGQSNTLKSHIDTVHKKLTPYQCKECKKYFGVRSNLMRHIDPVHKYLNPTSISRLIIPIL